MTRTKHPCKNIPNGLNDPLEEDSFFPQHLEPRKVGETGQCLYLFQLLEFLIINNFNRILINYMISGLYIIHLCDCLTKVRQSCSILQKRPCGTRRAAEHANAR